MRLTTAFSERLPYLRKTIFWAVSIVLVLSATLAATIPEDELGRYPALLDERIESLGHALGFLLISVSFWLLLHHAYGSSPTKAMILAYILCLGVSVATESLQFLVPTREASLLDLVLDMLGAMMGTTAMWMILKFKSALLTDATS